MQATPRLEVVKYQEHREDVTVQLALDGTLAVPFTAGKEIFYSWPSEEERHTWLERTARTLIDIYGDARHGLQLSDYEVSQRAAA